MVAAAAPVCAVEPCARRFPLFVHIAYVLAFPVEHIAEFWLFHEYTATNATIATASAAHT
jgi:hypothetical protein